MTKTALKYYANELKGKNDLRLLLQEKKRGLFWWLKVIATLIIELIDIITNEDEEN